MAEVPLVAEAGGPVCIVLKTSGRATAISRVAKICHFDMCTSTKDVLGAGGLSAPDN
jgi:hypothetical protein